MRVAVSAGSIVFTFKSSIRPTAMPHMAFAGLGRMRSAGTDTFARAIDGHLGPGDTTTAVALGRAAQGQARPGQATGWSHAA